MSSSILHTSVYLSTWLWYLCSYDTYVCYHRVPQTLCLLAGTTSVFWGMHLSGAMGLPRRMPDAPDMYLHIGGHVCV